MNRKYSPEQVEHLRAHPEYTLSQVKAYLGCSGIKATRMLRTHGIPHRKKNIRPRKKKKNNYYSPEQINHLRSNPQYTIRDAASYLGVSTCLAKEMMKYHKVAYKRIRGVLTEKGKELIAHTYKKLRYRQIAEILDLSWRSVEDFCQDNNLRKNSRPTRKTAA